MNNIEKEQKKIYDDQTKAFMKDRKANAAEKIAPLKESTPTGHTIEAHGTRGMKNISWRKTFKNTDHLNKWVDKNDSIEVHATRDLEKAKQGNLSPALHEEVAHKVGDTVYATHPVKRYTTMTGKVTRVGRTLTTLTHKDGTSGTYPHHDVNKDYEVLHPNPYKKNESVDEGKIVPTHSASGKPNPNHPAFATHKAKYDADKRAAQAPRAKAAPTESPVKLHHIDSAISNSYPDVEPYEHLARKFPDLHKAQGKTGSKLMDHLHDIVKKHKAGKDYHDYVNKAHADIKSDAEFDKRNESMEYKSFSSYLTEVIDIGKTVYTSHTDKVLKGKIVGKDIDNKDQYIVKHKDGTHSVHKDAIHFRKEHAGFMLEQVAEGVFDWKANKSELDWSDKKDKKTEKSAEGGTIHKARETERNAETGGKAAKKNVGRPAGEYGGYKIDKAKRDTPEAKAELSRKVMAAKKEGFAVRKDFKTAIGDAIKKRQAELYHADKK